MRVVLLVFVFLSCESSLASVNSSQMLTEHKRLTALQTTALLQLEGLPSNPISPFVFVFAPIALSMVFMAVLRYQKWSGDFSARTVAGIREFTRALMMKHDGYFFAKTVIPVMLIIFFVILVAAVQVVSGAALSFGFPLAAWATMADWQTKVTVAMVHFNMVMTLASVFMFTLPYLYRYLVNLMQIQDRTEGSRLIADEALRILSHFDDVEQLLTKLPPLPSVVEVPATTTTEHSEKSVPLTFATWKVADDSDGQEDPLRVLIAFFHPQHATGRCRQSDHVQQIKQLVARRLTAKVLPYEEMLKLAFEYHEAFDASSPVNGTDSKRVPQRLLRRAKRSKAAPPLQVRAKVQTAEQMQKAMETAEKLKAELAPQLKLLWKIKEFEADFRETERDDQLKDVMENCSRWGAFVITAILCLLQMLAYVGVGEDCFALIDDNGAVLQNQTWFYQSTSYVYPTIANAETWDCSAVACRLRCGVGYVAVNGITSCHDHGGPGVMWTHLTSDTSDVVACCANTADAQMLSSATIDATGTFHFTQSQQFSVACGNQSLAVQICSDQTKTAWQQKSICSIACAPGAHGGPWDSTVCSQLQVENTFPDFWANLDQVATLSSDMMANMTYTVTAGTKFALKGTVPKLSTGTLYRVLYNSNVNAVTGLWMRWAAS